MLRANQIAELKGKVAKMESTVSSQAQTVEQAWDSEGGAGLTEANVICNTSSQRVCIVITY